MGKATVVSKIAGTNSVTVRVDRDLGNLQAVKATVEQAIVNINASITQLDLLVADVTAQRDAAQVTLNGAIANQDEPQAIVALQRELITQTSRLASVRTEANVARLKRTNYQQRLTRVNNEIDKVIIVTIPTADSGMAIQVGQEIGIVEITRIANADSPFIALPSDSAARPERHIYNAQRDGIAQAKLGQPPHGWWYNTLVSPAAQIWVPRFWLGLILNKSDAANTAIVYIYRSEDFNYLPFRQSQQVHRDVPFEYEDTNSRAFNVGDRVLVEFDGENPRIIGFGQTERLESQPIAFYRDIIRRVGSPARGMLFRLGTRDAIDLANAITPSFNATITGEGTDNNSLSFLTGQTFETMDEFFGPGRSAESFSITNQDTEFVVMSIADSNAGIQTDLINFPTNSFFRIEQGGVSVPSIAYDIDVLLTGSQPDLTVEASGGGQFFRLTDTFLLDREESFPLVRTANWRFPDSGPAAINVAIEEQLSTLILSQPFGQAEPTTFTKLQFASAGLIAPSDWLFDNSFYVDTPRENQFLIVRQYRTFKDGDFDSIPLLRTALFDITPGIGFGLPPEFIVYPNPIATTGPQNFIRNSSSLTISGYLAQFGTISNAEILSPTNAQNAFLLLSSGLTSIAPNFLITSSRYAPLTLGVQYTFSIFVRRNSYCTFSVDIPNDARITTFDLIAGTFTLGSVNPADNASITELDEEWFRISVTFTPITDATPNITITPAGAPTDHNGLNGLLLFGPQINVGDSATTYRETTGTPIV